MRSTIAIARLSDLQFASATIGVKAYCVLAIYIESERQLAIVLCIGYWLLAIGYCVLAVVYCVLCIGYSSKTGECQGGPEGACLRQSLGLGAGQHQIWDLASPVRPGKTDRFERFHS
jgi:hypothetical protein